MSEGGPGGTRRLDGGPRPPGGPGRLLRGRPERRAARRVGERGRPRPGARTGGAGGVGAPAGRWGRESDTNPGTDARWGWGPSCALSRRPPARSQSVTGTGTLPSRPAR